MMLPQDLPAVFTVRLHAVPFATELVHAIIVDVIAGQFPLKIPGLLGVLLDKPALITRIEPSARTAIAEVIGMKRDVEILGPRMPSVSKSPHVLRTPKP